MDARLIIDRDRCAGTGVCLPIASPHLQLADGAARAVDGTTIGIERARAAAACCPNEAITVCAQPPAVFRVDAPIVTLGPSGTDAQAEAGKHTGQVRLVDSFPDAMRVAAENPGLRALVAAGYLALDAEVGLVDSWVDQHFTYTGVLRLERCWESPTKPMCMAVRRDIGRPIATVATHPATRVFATRYAPGARQVSVHAKPLAARAAAHAEVDACIASVDVAARYPQLEIRAEFAPTMVWLLYVKVGRDG
ncbi:ferredoxin [Nocardia gipuzkoensis]